MPSLEMQATPHNEGVDESTKWVADSIRNVEPQCLGQAMNIAQAHLLDRKHPVSGEQKAAIVEALCHYMDNEIKGTKSEIEKAPDLGRAEEIVDLCWTGAVRTHRSLDKVDAKIHSTIQNGGIILAHTVRKKEKDLEERRKVHIF